VQETQNKNKKTQNYQAKTQNNDKFLQRLELKTLNKVKSESKIQKKYEKKLVQLEIRESNLRKNEMELFAERDKLYKKQKSLLTEREELSGKQFADAEMGVLIKLLKKQVFQNNECGIKQEAVTQNQEDLLAKLDELKSIAYNQDENRRELYEHTQESMKHYFDMLSKATRDDESKLIKFLPIIVSGLTAVFVGKSSSETKNAVSEIKKTIEELA